jgi:hypothetical protein
VQVADSDGCWSIGQERCPQKLSTEQILKFNNQPESWCGTLKKGTPVCCSPGKKPDLRPKKNVDGSCATHITNGEYCKDIQDKYFLEEGDLEKFNAQKTWGCDGCTNLPQVI